MDLALSYRRDLDAFDLSIDAPAPGVERVRNGDGSEGIAGWVSAHTLTEAEGVFKCLSTSGAGPIFSQDLGGFAPGDVLSVTFDALPDGGASPPAAYLGTGPGTGDIANVGQAFGSRVLQHRFAQAYPAVWLLLYYPPGGVNSFILVRNISGRQLTGRGVELIAADLRHEDTLTSAILLSLMTDRLAEPDDVPAGADRRGWWADAYAQDGDRFGSRLWLLQREKDIPRTLQRARTFIQEALAWLVTDGFAKRVDLAVFSPRTGWLVAEVTLVLDAGSRRYRFEWSDERQVWTLAGEMH